MSVAALPSKTVAIPEQTRAEASSDFAALFEAHYARVVRALELGGLDRASAEDAAQEAFARTLGHWARVRTGSNPAGYVFKTAFRLARRNFRARPGRLVEWDEHLEATSAQLGDVSAEATTRVATERVLAVMPPRRRSCAVMCFVVGLSPKEAARALGIAEGTVRKQLEAARRAMLEGLSTG